jgi:hypothetical protein
MVAANMTSSKFTDRSATAAASWAWRTADDFFGETGTLHLCLWCIRKEVSGFGLSAQVGMNCWMMSFDGPGVVARRRLSYIDYKAGREQERFKG